MKILNLTQHKATLEQLQQGVVNVHDDIHSAMVDLLTFVGLPTKAEVKEVANKLAALVQNEIINSYEKESYYINKVMIGGAPFLMQPLANAIERMGYEVVYAFSERVSIETIGSDGTVTKVNQFKHIGFV